MIETWRTEDGRTLDIAEMATSHIENCIKMIERKWDDLDEEDDYLTADHWSLEGVVLTVPGKAHYRPKLKALKEELKKRATNE